MNRQEKKALIASQIAVMEAQINDELLTQQ